MPAQPEGARDRPGGQRRGAEAEECASARRRGRRWWALVSWGLAENARKMVQTCFFGGQVGLFSACRNEAKKEADVGGSDGKLSIAPVPFIQVHLQRNWRYTATLERSN